MLHVSQIASITSSERLQEVLLNLNPIGAKMRLPVTVGAKCYNIVDRIRTALGDRDDVMSFNVMLAGLSQKSSLFAALANTSRQR